MKPRMAQRTRIACIVGACILVISIIGIALVVQDINKTLGSVLVLLPLIIDTIGLVVITGVIGSYTKRVAKLSNRIVQKQAYVRLVCTVIVSFPFGMKFF